MKIRLTIVALLCSVCFSAFSQSFLKPLPKPNPQHLFTKAAATSGVFGVTQWNFRPIVSIVSYSVPGNELSTGAGAAYELNSYDPGAQRWSSVVSFSGLIYYNLPLNANASPGSVLPFAQNNAPGKISYIGAGLMVGVFDNHVLAGLKYDGQNVQFEIGTAINFNN